MKTSYKQDTYVVTDALQRCIESKDGIPYLGLIYHMKDSAYHVGVPREDSKSLPIEERIKYGKYGDYISEVSEFLVTSRLCYLKTKAYEQDPLPPREYYLLVPTRFGHFFVGLPYFLRWFYVSLRLFFAIAIEFIKKYRWIVSVGSFVAAAVRISQGHELTAAFLFVAGAIGIAAAVVIACISGVLSDHVDS